MGGTFQRSTSSVLLAFDTSGALGSVAVSRGGMPAARVMLDVPREHASLLVPSIDRALADAGARIRELAAVIVGEGPGSFTGVRVAAATAKGLAHALDIPLIAVSSLAGAALAVAASPTGDSAPVRYVLFDARADRVYGACYAVREASVEKLVAPFAGTVAEVLGAEVPEGAVFLGEGSRRHREAIEASGHRVIVEPSGEGAVPGAGEAASGSIAEGLIRFLALRPDHPPVPDPWAWEPSYLKESGAERLWTV